MVASNSRTIAVQSPGMCAAASPCRRWRAARLTGSVAHVHPARPAADVAGVEPGRGGLDLGIKRLVGRAMKQRDIVDLAVRLARRDHARCCAVRRKKGVACHIRCFGKVLNFEPRSAEFVAAQTGLHPPNSAAASARQARTAPGQSHRYRDCGTPASGSCRALHAEAQLQLEHIEAAVTAIDDLLDRAEHHA